MWRKRYSKLPGLCDVDEAKARLTRLTSVERSKVRGAPSLAAAPTANRAVLSAKQKRLGPGWDHVVHGGRVVRATDTKRNPGRVTETPTRIEVTNTSKKGRTTKSRPKIRPR